MQFEFSGGEKKRISPEAHGIVAKSDVLNFPGLDATFPGDDERRRVDVWHAIRRIDRIVEKQLKKEASPPVL